MLWVPDWPVAAHAQAERLPASAPLALIEKGEVFACSATARAEGVRRGMRQREAQSRCPQLQVVRYDPALDSRAFEPVLAALEQSLPGLASRCVPARSRCGRADRPATTAARRPPR